MKTLTAITTADYSAYLPNRAVFKYLTNDMTFARGPQYPAFSIETIQGEESTTSVFPVIQDPVVIQAKFSMAFPAMSDAELSNLRTFMTTTLPCGEQFTFIDAGNGRSFPVRFGSNKIKVRQLILDCNEVTLEMVRV